MPVYRIFHQRSISTTSTDTQVNQDTTSPEYQPNTVYVPQYTVDRVGHGQITINVYGYLHQPYKAILQVLENYLPHRDAEITIVFTLGKISQVFIRATELSPHTVGRELPPGEIYQKVADIVHKYYPNFEFRQFINGFLVRPMNFINISYLNDMYNDLISLYNGEYELWLSFGRNYGVVISFSRILGQPLPVTIVP